MMRPSPDGTQTLIHIYQFVYVWLSLAIGSHSVFP